MTLNLALTALVLAVLAFLFRPALRDAPRWRATVTPLASIIGSGFLVVVPLLGHAMGQWALAGIAAIVCLAYALGAVVRFNILHIEPLLDAGAEHLVMRLEEASRLALGLAYIISVAFYIRLLASFLLRAVAIDDPLIADTLSTLILGFIGTVGLLRGLHGLEVLEEYAVNVKLAIIAALLLGLGWHDLGQPLDWLYSGDHAALRPGWDSLPVLAGMLLIVQGFETSRFLGAAYSRPLRVSTMRDAQLIAAGIYLAFVALALPLLDALPEQLNETAVIDLSAVVSPILPALLVLAATLSQFSAAVADTLGGGGLLSESSRGWLAPRGTYLAMIGAAITLVWSADLFQIIAFASRAFALYYLLQVLLALSAARTAWQRTGLLFLVATLVYIVLFAVPVD